MSKGNKRMYKQFDINTIEDACLVLKSLIVPVLIDLEKFKIYSDEAKQMLQQYHVNMTIPAYVSTTLVSGTIKFQ